MVTVLFFAYLKDKVPNGKIVVDLAEGCSVQDLITLLTGQYSDLENKLENSIVAINHEFSRLNAVIPDNAEVAFFPPVSGGDDMGNIIALTSDDLSADLVTRQLTQNTTGAICCFTGIVRQKTNRGREQNTRELFYEAYESMAYEKMRQIANAIQSQWPDVERIALIQRIGLVPAGVPSVLVACASSHRDTGIFAAAQYGINRLKEIVPVWKKEITKEDEHWVSGDYHPIPGE
jgi:molybdopterin synthase catalytic subunit/molybdopterin converting factor small subunit